MVVGQLYNKYQIMKFKTLKTNLAPLKIKSYFKRFGLDEITKPRNFKKRKVNQMIDDLLFSQNWTNFIFYTDTLFNLEE